jgi:hypothetical protein
VSGVEEWPCFYSSQNRSPKMLEHVVVDVLPVSVCPACQWEDDELSDADDFTAFLPENIHLLCDECVLLVAGYYVPVVINPEDMYNNEPSEILDSTVEYDGDASTDIIDLTAIDSESDEES